MNGWYFYPIARQARRDVGSKQIVVNVDNMYNYCSHLPPGVMSKYPGEKYILDPLIKAWYGIDENIDFKLDLILEQATKELENEKL